VNFVEGGVRVRVPATSANLGPGFDALGLALSRYDDLEVRVAGSGLRIEISGEGEALPRDESHLVLRALRATFDVLGGQPPGLSLTCVNRIPHGRGLGSSAAAIVSGVVAARALVGDGATALPDPAALALATELEGHPDNVAACLLGGLTVAWTGPDGARAVRLDAVDAIRPVVLIPPFEASTKAARGLLPDVVPHADAAFAAGRAALLIAALTGATEALFAGTEDRLHQQYRVPAMPESAALVAELRSAGYPAVISGAGPTVLVLATSAAGAGAVAAAAPAGWLVEELAVDTAGARAVAADGG
jgi:homoserine kinase